MKIYYLAIPIFLFFISCAQSNATKSYCDDSLPCSEGYECLENKCEKILYPCSDEFKDGVCTNKDQECIEGVCTTKIHPKCVDITCSNKGLCIVEDNIATCLCEEGSHPEGLTCVTDGLIGCGNEECTSIQHCEEEVCLENIKKVSCDIAVNIPNNSEMIIVDLDIRWSNGVWETIPKCEWTCKQGYKEDAGKCVYQPFNCSLDHPEALCENTQENCIDGVCVLPEMGSICRNVNDCQEGLICILNGVENGYCTKACTSDTTCNEFSNNYKCGDFLSGKYCLKECVNNSYCRDDFVCTLESLCEPKCTNNDNCKSYESCNLNSGLCENNSLNCDIYTQDCGDDTRACYPFDEITQTACAIRGTAINGSSCSNDLDNSRCLPGSICTNVDNDATVIKRCVEPCRPSNDIESSNTDCDDYNRCIKKTDWYDLGYCKYDSSLVPVGVSCDIPMGCDYDNGSCIGGICAVRYCPQKGQVNTSIYPNEVICIELNLGGSDYDGLYWMDTCSSDSDCYSDDFVCHENTTFQYLRKYCMPR